MSTQRVVVFPIPEDKTRVIINRDQVRLLATYVSRGKGSLSDHKILNHKRYIGSNGENNCTFSYKSKLCNSFMCHQDSCNVDVQGEFINSCNINRHISVLSADCDKKHVGTSYNST